MLNYKLINFNPSWSEKVLALNESEIPKVNQIGMAELSNLQQMSHYFKLAISTEQQLMGFLLVLPPDTNYHSENYNWFTNRYNHFNYVDRIVVEKNCIGLGIGKSFYNDLLNFSKKDSQKKYIACEVNIKPMNQNSILFHQKMGFNEVGQRDSDGGKKRVSMMLKHL